MTGVLRPGYSAQAFLFTLTFPMGKIAILEVHGAANQAQARALAEKALPTCQYTVTAGDETGGHAELFYLWGCTSPSEGNAIRQDKLKER